ncbi:MAG: amidohydrolase family protein, partial [Betaproteobacteria bacterium]|nr:amidohydrolase family protein [Betaproteobacteria bacterium]
MSERIPSPVDLRIDARWVIPVEPAGVLADHALIVDAGRIVALVDADEADRHYAPRSRVALPSHALIPGLVNAHTHTAMTLLRGIADDVPLRAWLEQHIWPREGRFLAEDFVHDGTLLGAAEMLRGGTTCCKALAHVREIADTLNDALHLRHLMSDLKVTLRV